MRTAIQIIAAVSFAVAGMWSGPALGGIPCAPTCAKEKRVALVIGNSDYQHTRVLWNASNDAQAVAKLLREIGFAAADVTLKANLGYGAMREELRAFANKVDGADTAIIYYAGHGIELAGENYLVPVDAKLAREQDLDFEAVSLTMVLGVVGDARKLKLVILDACRNNPLGDKIKLRGGGTRDVFRGLSRIEPRGDTLVAYAAKAGTLAKDGAGRHSPYAEALLKHMPTPGLDIFRMFGRVKEAVLDATNKQQEPWLYGSPGGEAIALVAAPAMAASDTSLRKDTISAEEVRICREIEGMWSLSMLGALLEKYKGTAAGHCIAAHIEELKKKTVAARDPVIVVPQPNGRDAAGSPATEQASRGRALIRAGIYDEARRLLEKAAELGDPVAMSNLGTLYDDGKGVPQDYTRARGWYEKAAEKGEAAAMHNLASMFARGDGVLRSPPAAARYLLAAARAGDTTAREHLDGEMVPWAQDIRRAVQELLAAAGDYRGRADGHWGPPSRDAARAYYMRRN